MSAVQTWSGAAGLKLRSFKVVRHRPSVLGFTVVALNRRLCRARMPCSRISRLSSLLGGCNPPVPQFIDHPRRTVGALELHMNGADQRQHLRIRQPLGESGLPPRFQAWSAADADSQQGARQGQLVGLPMPVNPGVFHSASAAIRRRFF